MSTVIEMSNESFLLLLFITGDDNCRLVPACKILRIDKGHTAPAKIGKFDGSLCDFLGGWYL